MAETTAVNSSMSFGNRRPKRNRQREGELTISRSELLAEVYTSTKVTYDTGTKYLYPDTSSNTGQFAWLSALAKLFDRIKFHKMHIYWKPAVAATTDGQMTFGVDWNQNLSNKTAATISALTPSCQVPVWSDTVRKKMVLPIDRLQSMLWYKIGTGEGFDRGPGQFHYHVTHKSSDTATALGSFWVDYTVTLQGTSSA